MEPMLNLRDLLVHEIEDLYSAEEQIIEALPKMVEKAANRDLKAALNDHLKVTRQQKDRLDKVRKLLGQPSDDQKGFLGRMFGGGTKCKGTEGLIKEGQKMMSEDMDPKVLDAAIIASAQKIEHYEISGYGTARAYAHELGLRDVASLLESTLSEEYQADDSLTALALGKVNLEAGKGGVKSSARSLPTVRKAPAKGATKSSSSGSGKSAGKSGAGKKGSTSRSSGAESGSKKTSAKKSAKTSAKKSRR
jgi:ferritin-like metal-binding protein YciE